ncbi:MAG: DUF1427 family protein [Azospirillaceae bacterium]|nr:DUF1427 family protein [Azospirillaceae bacterium]
MKVYLLSLATGVLVGAIYALLNVRSPAPPLVALIGLLGILLGEQLPPVLKNFWQGQPVAHSWLEQVKPHMFGPLPKAGSGSPPVQMASIQTAAVQIARDEQR